MNERIASIGAVVSCMDGYDPDALPVDTACAAIRACLAPVGGVERAATRSALGRVLAETIVPRFDVPAQDNSAMDGWAVRSADLNPDAETALSELGSALAGKAYPGAVGAGQCVRIMTGAVMPAGTDAVVIQEAVKSSGMRVVIPAGQKRGQNVRAAGEDLKTGVPVLRPGRALTPADLGLIASLGIAEVAVRRRLRVAFFSTGDELASIGQPLAVGQVYDSNRYTLFGMLARLGVEPLDMGVVHDDPQQLEAAFRQAAASADAIVTSGGVSVGEADYVKPAVEAEGSLLMWKIAMKPGRPLAFGRVRGEGREGREAAFIGLPGNPVSSFVTFLVFVRPFLRRMQGIAEVAPRALAARADFDWPEPDARREFLRVKWNAAGGLDLYPTQDSAVMTSTAWADGLVDNPPNHAIRKGDTVRYLPFSELYG